MQEGGGRGGICPPCCASPSRRAASLRSSLTGESRLRTSTQPVRAPETFSGSSGAPADSIPGPADSIEAPAVSQQRADPVQRWEIV